MIANMRFNSYSREAVRRRFDKTPVRRTGGEFDQPVRIDCFGPGTQAWRCQWKDRSSQLDQCRIDVALRSRLESKGARSCSKKLSSQAGAVSQSGCGGIGVTDLVAVLDMIEAEALDDAPYGETVLGLLQAVYRNKRVPLNTRMASHHHRHPIRGGIRRTAANFRPIN
jgi:hypothetical protein